ncbi:MAG: hypothetical protein ABI551_12830 [Polyangiaceae bacterium]
MRPKAKTMMLLATLVLGLAQARSAHAAETPAEAPPSWYGWEYAAADVTGLALLVDARADARGPLVNAPYLSEKRRHLPFIASPTQTEAIGSGLYLLGAPTAHLANGHPVNALVSLALRAAPLLYVQLTAPIGGLVGFFVRDSHGQRASCESGGGICIDLAQGSHANDGITTGADIGLFGGAAAAVLVDQVLLSRESIGAKPKRVSFAGALTPDVRVGNGSAYAGIGGRF